MLPHLIGKMIPNLLNPSLCKRKIRGKDIEITEVYQPGPWWVAPLVVVLLVLALLALALLKISSTSPPDNQAGNLGRSNRQENPRVQYILSTGAPACVSDSSFRRRSRWAVGGEFQPFVESPWRSKPCCARNAWISWAASVWPRGVG